MRYIKHYLEGITGVEIYPLISLLLFFFFFVALAWYVYTADKSHIRRLSQMPLDNDPQNARETDNP